MGRSFMIYLYIMIFSQYVHDVMYVMLCTSSVGHSVYIIMLCIFIIRLICQVLSYMFGHGSKDHIKIKHETSYFNILIMQCAIF